MVTGVLAVGPAAVGVGAVVTWVGRMPGVHTENAALAQGYDPKNPQVESVAVDGSLPDSPVPLPLPAYELPNGPLGIPVTALAAYRNAAGVLGREQPGCHIDWALIASIGRIESNHARGGYLDAAGNTLEPILGPELNGTGPYAAIPDTDHGLLDRDTVWDRAVGPAQFIPATWRAYASDGNGDGIADPNNIFDSSLATGRYLCSGGLDLANPDQLRTAIYRYNNSDAYVNTVVLWAEAYRNGVAPTPDSQVPVGAPNAAAVPAPPAVPPPPVPPSSPAAPPASSLPPSGEPSKSRSSSVPVTGSSSSTCTGTSSPTTSVSPSETTSPTPSPCDATTSATPGTADSAPGTTGGKPGS
ncbi:lytic transglycosylase domain-containing protein [Amycolatopsis sp. PS_44_ISF1]|uniref:lytic transglycosylase domain-containing protein n=1 Tax=Amycolatopsis sp. PS_44_ISF1 TaxID=2974917 RepID=UPI0028DECDB9|nr:lytic transglycosylase domain-containing protein [Amycolatopsis sp. PS_44_ISF1]MDT8911394.1 lytic transglycosylase domain-containing protein [Amycolatopsis sp. PS_44_ISF1]